MELILRGHHASFKEVFGNSNSLFRICLHNYGVRVLVRMHNGKSGSQCGEG